jgi:hypothetical protein
MTTLARKNQFSLFLPERERAWRKGFFLAPVQELADIYRKRRLRSRKSLQQLIAADIRHIEDRPRSAVDLLTVDFECRRCLAELVVRSECGNAAIGG